MTGPGVSVAGAWSDRRVRLAAGVLAALALFGALGFLAVPPLARGQIEALLSAELGRTVRVERVGFNPFTLRAQFDGVSVADRDPANPPLLAFDVLEVNASWRSLFERAPVIDSAKLVAPRLSLARAADGRLGIQDLLDKWQARPSDPNAPPARFMVSDVEVLGGRIEFDDRLADRRHRVEDVRLSLPFLSSLPGHRTIEVEPKVSARVEGGRLEVAGRALPFADDRRATVDLAAEAIDLTHFLPYLPATLPVRIASLGFGGDLKIDFSQSGGEPSLTIGGQVELSKVDVLTLAGAPLLAIDSLRAGALKLAPMAASYTVGRLEFDRARATVNRRRNEARFFEPVLAAIDAGAARPTAGPEGPGRAASAPVPGQAARAAPPDGHAPKSTAPRWAIDEILVKDASVEFSDERFAPRALRLKATGLNARATGVGGDASAAIPFELALALDTGERLEASGSVRPAPLAVEGKASLERMALKNWWWIAEPRLSADLSDGALDLRTGFRVALGGAVPDVSLTGLSADLSDLRIRQRWDRREFLQLGRVKLAEVDLDLAGRKLGIGRVEATGGRLALERDRDGVLNLSRLAGPPATVGAGAATRSADRPVMRGRAASTSATAPTTAPAPASAPGSAVDSPWSFALNRVTVDGWNLSMTDAVAGPAADLKVADLSLRAEGLSSARNSRGKVALKAKVGRAGSLDASGTLGLEPIAGRLRVDARSIGILAAQPYFARFVNAIVSSGALTARGNVAFEVPDRRPPKASFSGDVTIADFAAVTREANEDLLRWKSLYFGGIDFALDPPKVTLGEIALTDFFAKLVLSPQGRLNVPDLIVHPPPPDEAGATAAATTAPGPGQADAPLPLTIGRITLASGHVDFTDLFVKPNYSTNLTGLNGSVSALSADTAGDLELRGQIDNSGSVEIKGRLNPLAPAAFVDLQAAVRDIDLPRTSPYSVRYLGYGIEKGKLSANLKYTLHDRKLQAENNIILDQLTFGEPVESPTATRLPVLLAVALLKDRRGVIDVNLPVAGSLDDPQFSIGGIVVRIIFNLIAKAVTAPFSLIAGILGSGGAELSQVEFAAGRAELGPDSLKRLEALAKALLDRPAVKVDLAGRVDPEPDREALVTLAFERRLKAEKIRERAGAGTESGSLDALAIEPGEYDRLLRLAYRSADFAKPRNAIGLVKDLPPADMEKLIRVNTRITDDALAGLANERAEAVKAWLITQGGVPGERVFVVAPRLGAEGVAAGKSTLAVDVSLK